MESPGLWQLMDVYLISENWGRGLILASEDIIENQVCMVFLIFEEVRDSDWVGW